VVVEKSLPAPLTQPVMWHIDEFASLAAAEKASGPNGVAFQAHGSAWIYTIESDAGRVKSHRWFTLLAITLR
jgi:sugar lactone lactonase YvrE